jgi:hypothetical protein
MDIHTGHYQGQNKQYILYILTQNSSTGQAAKNDGVEGKDFQGECVPIPRLTILGQFGGAHQCGDLEGIFTDGAAPKTLHALACG